MIKFHRSLFMKRFCLILSLIACFATVAVAQDTKLKILDQPKPELPKNHSTLDIKGSVILSIQFLDFGEIGEITPIKTLPEGLTERAVVAARKIKFEPEKKGAQPVTVTRQIEYVYSWNGGWSFPSEAKEVTPAPTGDAKTAEAIIAKAIQNLGGEKYLQVKTQIGRGTYYLIREDAVIALKQERGVASFQKFVDVLVFPDKERTEFKGAGTRNIQVNSGNTGWMYDSDLDAIKVQNEAQIDGFKLSIRASLDNLLRGSWKGDAELTYVGKRPSTLGKRNDVIRLTYKDGFAVEFEFAAEDGLPQKSSFKRTSNEGEEVKEEDRYAQFIDIGGVKTPFVIDRYTNGQQTSRITYDSVEFNKVIPDSIFAKPANPKDAKKDIKF